MKLLTDEALDRGGVSGRQGGLAVTRAPGRTETNVAYGEYEKGRRSLTVYRMRHLLRVSAG